VVLEKDYINVNDT